jgi:membrane dipeptidase
MTAGAAITLRSPLGWGAGATDPRVADIVAKTIGIDTHNHIDVPLTAAETQWGDLVDDVQDRSLDMLPYTPKPSLVP